MPRLRNTFTFIVGMLTSAVAIAQVNGPLAVEGEYLIKYKDSVARSASVRNKLMTKANLKASFSGLGVYQVSLKAGSTVDEISSDPDVEYIEPNYFVYKGDSVLEGVVESLAHPSDQGVYSQAKVDIGISDAWRTKSVRAAEGSVVVAVIDSGLSIDHPVFRSYDLGGTGALWINEAELYGEPGKDDDMNGFVDDINGWNFISNSGKMIDDDGHGTHVAGIVVGAGLNIFSDQLEKSSIKIMPLKFLKQGGSGTTADAIKAIYYAVNNGANVINNSWGGSGYSKALQDAMAYAYQRKVILVSAAGNYNSDNDSIPVYPSNYDIPSNISVAATDASDSLAYFSNYGDKTVHVGAPGKDITSTYRAGGYATMSGTSMAAPLVSGLAALALLEAPNLTGYQVKELLMSSSQRITNLQKKVITESRVAPASLVAGAQQLVYSSSSQPGYVSVDRNVAGVESAGGCGLVKSLVKDGPGRGDGGAGSPMGIILGLLMVPLIVWQVLRRRAPETRRRYERFNMNSEIKVNVGGRELVGSMRTISEGGLSFSADEALEKGGIVTMRVQSPDGKEVIEVQGEVVWSEANKAYGVQFSNAKQGSLAMIRDWTSGLKNSAG